MMSLGTGMCWDQRGSGPLHDYPTRSAENISSERLYLLVKGEYICIHPSELELHFEGPGMHRSFNVRSIVPSPPSLVVVDLT